MEFKDLTDEEQEAVKKDPNFDRITKFSVVTREEELRIQRQIDKEIKKSKVFSEEFLKELTQLSLKHKIAIKGCGCCDSPFLEIIPEDFMNGYYVSDKNSGNIRFIKENPKEEGDEL